MPTIDWIRGVFKVDCVDMITRPGIVKILADQTDEHTIANIKHSVANVSVNHHASRVIVVSGHYDCAANKANKAGQIMQLKRSLQLISSFGFRHPLTVVPIWIGESWDVEEVLPRMEIPARQEIMV